MILVIATGIFANAWLDETVLPAGLCSLDMGCWIPSRVERRSRTAHSVDVCDERNLWYDKVKKVVQKTCQAKGIDIKKEGGIEAAEIDRRMLVDRHYCSNASKAALKKPTELNIPMDKFKKCFGVDWDEAVEAGKVSNAKDVCENFKSTQTR